MDIIHGLYTADLSGGPNSFPGFRVNIGSPRLFIDQLTRLFIDTREPFLSGTSTVCFRLESKVEAPPRSRPSSSVYPW